MPKKKSTKKTSSRSRQPKAKKYDDHGFAILNRHFSESKDPALWKAWTDFAGEFIAMEQRIEDQQLQDEKDFPDAYADDDSFYHD